MSDNPDETVYYLRFIAVFIDVATETVLKVFYHLIQSYKGTQEFLSSPEVKKKIITLYTRKGKHTNETHYNLLNAYVPDASKFDISLLITLITEIALPLSPGKSSYPSLSKDLISLRKIRNSIIAHKPKAALYKEKFGKLWTELEDILTRLNYSVDPATTDELAERIGSYRNRFFKDQDDHKYKQMFEESCEENSRLQRKMEDLKQKCNEFTIFFRKTPEKYFQYVQLLFEGGKFVLINVLSKGLAENKLDLRTVLFCKMNELEKISESRELLGQIFKNDGEASYSINDDTNTWDIIVLAEVIEVSLGLKDIQMKRVRTIKDARKNYADTALKAIAESDIQRFYGCCEDLVSSIEVLASFLDDDTQMKCDEHISRYKTQLTDDQATNYDDYLNQLKAHGTGIKNLSELYQESVEKLNECVKQMNESGMQFEKEHVLNLKMIILGENKEKKQEAEDALHTVLESSLAKSHISPELAAPRQEADKIFEVLHAIPDVKTDDLKRECIILSIRCFSCQNLLNVINYLTGELFKEHILSLAMELSFVFDEVIAIEGNLTFESLNDILTNLRKDGESTNEEPATDGISLPVVCFSPEGMQSVLKFVNSESFTNSINVIADSLSSYVDDTLSLKVIPDCKELPGIVEETDSETSSSSDSYKEESDYIDRFQRNKITENNGHCISFGMDYKCLANQNEVNPELSLDMMSAEYSESKEVSLNEDKEVGSRYDNHICESDSARFSRRTWNSEEKYECNITPHLSSTISWEQEETTVNVPLQKVKPDDAIRRYVDVQSKNAFKKEIIRHYSEKHTSLPVGLIREDVQFTKLYVRPFPLYDIAVKNPNGVKEIHDLHSVLFDGKNICKNIYITSETGIGKTAFMKWLTLCWCKAHIMDEDTTICKDKLDVFSREDIEEMVNFEFVFYISVGDVTFDKYQVDHLIYNAIVSSLPESKAYEMDFLEAILDTENCLIILDGIDESTSERSSMLPEIIKRPSSSYITTCTTRTFGRLKIDLNEVEKHIQIRSLERDKSEELSRNILSVVSEGKEEVSKSTLTVLFSPCLYYGIMGACRKFDRWLVEKKISHLKSFPALLAHLLSLWLVEEKLDISQCEIYSGIILEMLKRSSLRNLFSHQLLTFKTDEPAKEECLQIFEPYQPLFMQLGRLAYNTLPRLQREPYLGFKEDDAIKILSTEVSFPPVCTIETALNIGILHTQTDYSRKEYYLSFFHKSVHEFFAALYMSCNISTIEQVKSGSQSVLSLLEYAAVFVFLSGLNESSAQNILEHVANVLKEDEIFSKYRCTVNSKRIPEIKFIQDIVIDCIKESRDSARGKLKLSLKDIVVDSSYENKSYLKNLKNVLMHSNIESLSIEEYGSQTDEYKKYLVFEGFELTRLLKLRIERYSVLPVIRTLTTLQYIHLKCIVLAHDCISWYGIIAVFDLPMIEALGLEDIHLTHNYANGIIQMLNGKTNLKQIVLRKFECKTHREKCSGLELDLTNHKNLHLLDVYNIPVTKVQVNSERLEDLTVGRLPDNSTSLLFQGVKTASNLKRIVCISILESRDINQMVLALPKFTSLFCLDLSGINLDKKTIDLPPEMEHLEEIKLTDVTITVNALIDLVEKLQLYKQRVTMSIVGCYVEPEIDFKLFQDRIISSPKFRDVLIDDDRKSAFCFSTRK